MLLYRILSLLAFTVLFGFYGQAQKRSLHWYGHVGAGSFSYTGPGVNNVTFLQNGGPVRETQGAFANPYTHKAGLALRAGAGGQFTTSRGLVLNASLNYERLRNQVTLTRSPLSSYSGPVNGEGTFTTQYVTLSTMVGKQLWKGRKRHIELLAGLDHGFLAGNREVGSASSEVSETSVDDKRQDIPNYDLRVSGQVSVHQGRAALLVGYHQGLTDFNRNKSINNNGKVFSRYWLAGLSFRIF